MTQHDHSSGTKRGRIRKAPAAFAVVLCLAASAARADITNDATAVARYGAATVTSAVSSASVPVVALKQHLTVKKTASVTAGVKPGDVVTYTYAVTNDGNATITGIALTDAHDGSGAPPIPGNETLTADTGIAGDSTDVTPSDGVWSVLAPGDTVTFTATYTVTQTDLDTRQ